MCDVLHFDDSDINRLFPKCTPTYPPKLVDVDSSDLVTLSPLVIKDSLTRSMWPGASPEHASTACFRDPRLAMTAECSEAGLDSRSGYQMRLFPDPGATNSPNVDMCWNSRFNGAGVQFKSDCSTALTSSVSQCERLKMASDTAGGADLFRRKGHQQCRQYPVKLRHSVCDPTDVSNTPPLASETPPISSLAPPTNASAPPISTLAPPTSAMSPPISFVSPISAVRETSLIGQSRLVGGACTVGETPIDGEVVFDDIGEATSTQLFPVPIRMYEGSPRRYRFMASRIEPEHASNGCHYDNGESGGVAYMPGARHRRCSRESASYDPASAECGDSGIVTQQCGSSPCGSAQFTPSRPKPALQQQQPYHLSAGRQRVATDCSSGASCASSPLLLQLSSSGAESGPDQPHQGALEPSGVTLLGKAGSETVDRRLFSDCGDDSGEMSDLSDGAYSESCRSEMLSRMPVVEDGLSSAGEASAVDSDEEGFRPVRCSRPAAERVGVRRGGGQTRRHQKERLLTSAPAVQENALLDLSSLDPLKCVKDLPTLPNSAFHQPFTELISDPGTSRSPAVSASFPASVLLTSDSAGKQSSTSCSEQTGRFSVAELRMAIGAPSSDPVPSSLPSVFNRTSSECTVQHSATSSTTQSVPSALVRLVTTPHFMQVSGHDQGDVGAVAPPCPSSTPSCTPPSSCIVPSPCLLPPQPDHLDVQAAIHDIRMSMRRGGGAKHDAGSTHASPASTSCPGPSDSGSQSLTPARQNSLGPAGSPAAPSPASPVSMDTRPVWIPRRQSGGYRKLSTNCDDPPRPLVAPPQLDTDEADTDQETDRLLGQQRELCCSEQSLPDKKGKRKEKSKEGSDSVLIEGVLFRARYLGSTQLMCDGHPTKTTRMSQAEEAVSRIKAPNGESQPSTEVDLFISTEKIMVLNTDLKEIMMDHSLRTISYIADIGQLVVLMARRRSSSSDNSAHAPDSRSSRMICHVFESDEAQFIAQSIGQAFQVAYVEFLKANGIEDHNLFKEMDYQDVLNSQEIFGEELRMFAKKELQKEVIVPKQKCEILGVVIVESGWGSLVPTVVVANLAPGGAAARCGLLNIGDQIIAINGVSLVGLPLVTCQGYVKNTRQATAVKLTVVPCAPVVEVRIRRPDTKYQLGFSVQNGIICSLLRGGIAERGGVRVGHRIIEIDGQSVVAVPHERIVSLLANSVGEILMKTMPTALFRLLTGQETPIYI